MDRGRIGVGLLATTIGTAWSAGALPAVWSGVITGGPYLLVTVAVVAAGRVAAPRGVLIGPAVLLGAAALWLLIRYDMLPMFGFDTGAGIALVVGGFVVALAGDGRRRPQLTPVRRFAAVIIGRRPSFVGTAPAKVSAVALLALAVIDLSEAEFPDFGTVHIDVTVFGGRVEIVLPRSWKVVPGRIHACGVSFVGSADLTLPTTSDVETSGEVVVVSVLGLAGIVDLIAHRPRE